MLLGIWAPHAKSEAVSAINRRHDELRSSAEEAMDKISSALGRPVDGDDGEEKTRKELIALEEAGENPIRKVLRLRMEASKALSDFLLAEGPGVAEGRDTLREKLLMWGAKMPSTSGKERRGSTNRKEQ